MNNHYTELIDVLKNGSISELEEYAIYEDNFPDGKDDYLFRHWINNAIDIGSFASIKWMLDKGVNLNFRCDDGYTVLHSALERNKDDKYQILELLLERGAPVDLKGNNDWTPAHHAAARNDVRALEMLVKYNADLSIRTEIDDYTTPLEEAILLKCEDSVNYLRSITK